jgi:membrane protein
MQRAQLNQAGVLHNIATLIISIRVVPGFLLLFLMFVAMYRELANHRITVKMAAPGALFSAVSWIAVSFGFSIYINYFSSYSKIYGSLTALAIAMLWVYMMMNLLLLGGEINVYLTTQYPDVFPPAKAKKHKLRSLGRRNSRHTEK